MLIGLDLHPSALIVFCHFAMKTERSGLAAARIPRRRRSCHRGTVYFFSVVACVVLVIGDEGCVVTICFRSVRFCFLSVF
jgi:hypothetical protein